MRAKKMREVLDVESALDEREAQVADITDQRYAQSKDSRPPPLGVLAENLHRRQNREAAGIDNHGETKTAQSAQNPTAEESFPSLIRGNARGHMVFAEEHADKIRPHIIHDIGQENEDDEDAAVPISEYWGGFVHA